jgi:biopolymer transport protein ExbD
MQSNSAGSRMQSNYAGSLTQGSYAARMRKPAELMLVPMIDIFTVLVTFLLMTAVFSRITILQLDLPSAAASGAPQTPMFRLEVIVRKEGFELTNGTKLIAAIPKVNGAYDLKTLSDLAVSLKRDYPDSNDASVLLERDIEYDYLIQVMDVVRSAEVPAAAATSVTDPQQSAPSGAPAAQDVKTTRMALFAHIAVGEAP